jgi:hypothetical protein
MKKFFAFMIALFVVFIFTAPMFETPTAEAQVVYTRKCCDSSGTVRCILENWTPVTNPCFCYGQGWGYAC